MPPQSSSCGELFGGLWPLHRTWNMYRYVGNNLEIPQIPLSLKNEKCGSDLGLCTKEYSVHAHQLVCLVHIVCSERAGMLYRFHIYLNLSDRGEDSLQHCSSAIRQNQGHLAKLFIFCSTSPKNLRMGTNIQLYMLVNGPVQGIECGIQYRNLEVEITKSSLNVQI